MKLILALSLTFFFTTPVNAELYKYSQLAVKSYDSLIEMVHKKIAKAAKVDEEAQKLAADINNYDTSKSIYILKDALRLIFSRPNKDNMVEKLLPEVRSELKSYNAFYDSINDLVVESITGLTQKIPVIYKSTYIFVLENIMSEFRPDLKTNKDVKKIFIYIRDSGAGIPDDVRLDRKLRSMFRSRSPSSTARKIIEQDLPKKERQEKKGFWESLFS